MLYACRPNHAAAATGDWNTNPVAGSIGELAQVRDRSTMLNLQYVLGRTLVAKRALARNRIDKESNGTMQRNVSEQRGSRAAPPEGRAPSIVVAAVIVN